MTSQPTARELIKAKPPVVQIVLRVHATKASLEDPAPDWERYGASALEWWDGLVAQMRAAAGDDEPPTESQLAERVIAGLRKQEVWGKILRGNAQ